MEKEIQNEKKVVKRVHPEVVELRKKYESVQINGKAAISRTYFDKTAAALDYDVVQIEIKIQQMIDKKQLKQQLKDAPPKKKKVDIVLPNGGQRKYIIKTPDHIMSSDEFYLFLYEHIKKSVYVLRGKYYTLAQANVKSEDLVQEIFIKVIRKARVITKVLVNPANQYKIGDVVKTSKKNQHAEITSFNEEGEINRVKIVDKPLTYETDIDANKSRRVITVDDKGEDIITSIYDKYLNKPDILTTVRCFINEICRNHFKDYLKGARYTTPLVSLEAPIPGPDNLTIEDSIGVEDIDNTAIGELMEKCKGVVVKSTPLSDILEQVILGLPLTTICKEFKLSISTVRDKFEQIGIREILG